MPNPGPFEISIDQLARLSPEVAVDLVRSLLWLEAGKLGLSKALVNVPSWITVGDGGIDAEVTNVPSGTASSIIFEGQARYQVKTGEFSLGNVSNVRDVLCKPSQPGKARELNTRIKSGLDNGEILVVILFGWDGPEKTDDDLLTRFRNELEDFDPSYAKADIRFLRANQIVGLLSDYPSLRVGLLGGNVWPFSSHNTWSSFQDMSVLWTAGSDQEDFIQTIRSLVRDSSNGHLRIIGEPGLGKTRAALEALRETDLAALALYSSSPNGVLGSELVRRMLDSDSQASAILVVDECGYREKAELINQLGSRAPRIKLITIDSEPDASLGPAGYLSPKPLDNAQICEIICSYGNAAEEVNQWIRYCSGSPRVAHVLGINLKKNPEDLTRPLENVLVWDRYIAGKDEIGSDKYKRRRKVLLWLSLFKRFGYVEPYANEARAIARKIEVEEGISWCEFQEIVGDLRNRRILQGAQTLYITPRLLHIWLWNNWFDLYGMGGSFSRKQFRLINPSHAEAEYLPDSLMRWMDEMFRYANASGGNDVAHRMLGVDGPFDFGYLNSAEGSRFFKSLAEAAPRPALQCLQRILGRLTVDNLRHFEEGRRNCVSALEMIVIWRDLFAGAARLLLRLAEAETERWANNASGIFVSLFSTGPVAAAPTEASPEERLPVLKEALCADSPARRSIGVAACEVALSTGPFTRMLGPERQGLRKAPELWKPKTYGEWFNAYRAVWQMCEERLRSLGAEEGAPIADVLLKSARSLAAYEQISEMVIAGLSNLASEGLVSRKNLLAQVEEILYFDRDRLSTIIVESWESVRGQLLGSSFHDRLVRYAGMQLLVDRVERVGSEHKSVDKSLPELIRLAQESIESPDSLDAELKWLVTPEAPNGYIFGRELGDQDLEFKLMPRLLEAQNSKKATSAYFLAGYFSAMKDRDPEKWEDTMDKISQDDELNTTVAELTWRSGPLSDRAAERVLNLAKQSEMDPRTFKLFSLGRANSTVSETVFLEWIRFLLYVGTTDAIVTGLDLMTSYFESSGIWSSLPIDETKAVLSHGALFERECQIDTMGRYYWTQLAKQFVAEYPDETEAVVSTILEHLGQSGGLVGGFHSEAMEIVTEAARLQPEMIWKLVTTYIGPPIDLRNMALRDWLHSSDIFAEDTGGALEYFPADLVWQWVDEDPEERAWYIANIVPKRLFREPGKTCFAREVLVRYGDRSDVRSEMHANLWSGGWTGPSSDHFANVAAQLITFRSEETNPVVLEWLNDAISSFESEASRAKGAEERGEF